MPGGLFLGVDGGGTCCRARLQDASGRVLGEGLGGPANVRLDPAVVMQSILTAARAAAEAAGLDAGALAGAHAGLGLAGANLGSACTRLLHEVHPFASVTVETDAYAAWLGAHAGEDGAILIVGTGSCGLAVIGGRQFYVGGWGAEISDEGSGMMLGREAIRRSLWAYDGRAPATPLTEAVLGRFDFSAEAIVAFATSARAGDYGRLAPLVIEHAQKRDPLALALMADAANDVGAILLRLLDAGAPAVCLLGGLADAIRPWLPPVLRSSLSSPRGDALDGAILLARLARAPADPLRGDGV